MRGAMIFDKDGRFVRMADDDPVLKDGEVVRVRSMLMDSADPQAIIDAATKLQPVLHRPGFASISNSMAAERERLYQKRAAIISDAWRNPPPLDTATPLAPAPVKTADALESAHMAYIHQLTNAWRSA